MGIVGLLVLAFVLFAIYNAGFKSGKQLGSRKGYGVGFDRGRRGRNSSGCLVFVLAGLGAVVAAAALAMC